MKYWYSIAPLINGLKQFWLLNPAPIYGTGLFTYIGQLIFMVNVSKYTKAMDAEGKGYYFIFFLEFYGPVPIGLGCLRG